MPTPPSCSIPPIRSAGASANDVLTVFPFEIRCESSPHPDRRGGGRRPQHGLLRAPERLPRHDPGAEWAGSCWMLARQCGMVVPSHFTPLAAPGMVSLGL